MTDNSQRRAWMESHLDWAAREFGVEQIGQPLHTSRFHSVGCRVTDAGEDAWLRVVYADPEWAEGNYLENSRAANAIQGVPKPTVKRWRDWEDNRRRMRGEVSTFVADAALSAKMTPTHQVAVSDQWLSDLSRALRILADHPVPSHGVDADYVNDGIRAFFGIDLDIASVPWTTAHCDLHWGNLTGPKLAILDWETWGRAPVGYDAATLVCTSLAYPDLAQGVSRSLAEFLDTPTGHVATLAAATRLLRFADGGELTELARPVRQHAMDVLNHL
ncbi:aminoglycoside phosphotransferase [Kribbella sindirgiensis]|uniref:Aminoglycoside phosphotransferase n=1 Tax=Kribbella sindirgiensis TaxID=1124744 RepID=A0A4R0I158_9ACTN|nr:aminoglycoside phosphotransferase [Kribbella sindirgiensis]TCC17121.1 aminoglycoside phosphotransferase [Kribbella sindirgiensis]